MINCLALKKLFIDERYKHCASDNVVGEAPPPAARQSSAANPISLRPSPGLLSSVSSLAHATVLSPLLALLRPTVRLGTTAASLGLGGGGCWGCRGCYVRWPQG